MNNSGFFDRLDLFCISFASHHLILLPSFPNKSPNTDDFAMDYTPNDFLGELGPNGRSHNNNNNNNNNNGEGVKANGHAGGSKSDGEDNDHNPKVPSKQQKFNPKKQLKKSKYSAAQERVRSVDQIRISKIRATSNRGSMINEMSFYSQILGTSVFVS